MPQEAHSLWSAFSMMQGRPLVARLADPLLLAQPSKLCPSINLSFDACRDLCFGSPVDLANDMKRLSL